MSRSSVDDLPVGSEAATSSGGISRHGGAQTRSSLSLVASASSSSTSVLMPAFVIDPDLDKLASTTPLSRHSCSSDRSSRRRRRRCFMGYFTELCSQMMENLIHFYYRVLYRFVDPPIPVSDILPITDPIYIAKWEHMQHRPTITDLRKGTHPVTLTYDDGYIHEHIMVALAQYGWGKAAMIQDEHKPTTYRLSFMVDPIEYCQHNNKGVSYCIHFKFIIDDQWTLSREYFKVSECNGQVINNYLCLMPTDESCLRPRSGYVW
uniref:Chitin synthase n=1 Tax=Panagrellus redivivus TaxID=6233 RepID=A0A7E4UZ67_PANRE